MARMTASPHKRREHAIQKGALTCVHENMPSVHCDLKTTPAPKHHPCPQVPFPPQLLNSDTNNPLRAGGSECLHHWISTPTLPCQGSEPPY